MHEITELIKVQKPVLVEIESLHGRIHELRPKRRATFISQHSLRPTGNLEVHGDIEHGLQATDKPILGWSYITRLVVNNGHQKYT